MLNQFGCLLDQGRTRRVVSARLRDQHCRFPGCQILARRCHAHHLWHWADGGPTDLQNLILLCDRHHHAVHDGGWAPGLHGDGTVAWTSPTGQAVTTAAEFDTLNLPPPEPDIDNDHPDGDWIRPATRSSGCPRPNHPRRRSSPWWAQQPTTQRTPHRSSSPSVTVPHARRLAAPPVALPSGHPPT